MNTVRVQASHRQIQFNQQKENTMLRFQVAQLSRVLGFQIKAVDQSLDDTENFEDDMEFDDTQFTILDDLNTRLQQMERASFEAKQEAIEHVRKIADLENAN